MTSPQDPFSGDPDDPAAAFGDDDTDHQPPLSPQDREEVLSDLADLEIFQTLLSPRGIKGLLVDCADCHTPHYFGWDLLRANLREVLDLGAGPVHEPAHEPDLASYVSWDYARGFVDGVEDSAAC